MGPFVAFTIRTAEAPQASLPTTVTPEALATARNRYLEESE